jgi:hypothetical protein
MGGNEVKRFRRKAIDELVKNGGALIGRPEIGPMDRKTAERLVGRVSDYSIAQQLPGDDKDPWYVRLRKWLYLHKDEILFIIKVILTLALMFLDERPEHSTADNWTIYGYDRNGYKVRWSESQQVWELKGRDNRTIMRGTFSECIRHGDKLV